MINIIKLVLYSYKQDLCSRRTINDCYGREGESVMGRRISADVVYGGGGPNLTPLMNLGYQVAFFSRTCPSYPAASKSLILTRPYGLWVTQLIV